MISALLSSRWLGALAVLAGTIGAVLILRGLAQILPRAGRAWRVQARARPALEALVIAAGVAGSTLVGLGDRPEVAWAAVGLLATWALWSARVAASDVVSGILLKAEGQLQPGIRIEVSHHSGEIQRLGWRAVEIEQDDGSHLWVPFSHLAGDSIALRSATGSGDAHSFQIPLPERGVPDRVVERAARAAQLCPRSSLVRKPRVEVRAVAGAAPTLFVTVYPISPIFAAEVEESVRTAVRTEAPRS